MIAVLRIAEFTRRFGVCSEGSHSNFKPAIPETQAKRQQTILVKYAYPRDGICTSVQYNQLDGTYVAQANYRAISTSFRPQLSPARLTQQQLEGCHLTKAATRTRAPQRFFQVGSCSHTGMALCPAATPKASIAIQLNQEMIPLPALRRFGAV